jgi:hypothetical protein
VLEPAVCVGAADVDDPELPVDVAPVKPEELRRPQSGRGREDHQRSARRPELRGHGFDLPPSLEWTLLLRPSCRVGDAELGRVVVEQSPADGAVENLPEGLCRLEAMPLRNAEPPPIHISRRQIRLSLLPQHPGRLREQPAQLRDRHRRRLMHLQVVLYELGERDRRPPASRSEPLEPLNTWPCWIIKASSIDQWDRGISPRPPLKARGSQGTKGGREPAARDSGVLSAPAWS